MSERLSFPLTPIPKRCVDLPCLQCAWKVLSCALLVSSGVEFHARAHRGAHVRLRCPYMPRRAAAQRGYILHFCFAAERVMRRRRSSSKSASTRDTAHWDHAINASSWLVLSSEPM